MTRKKDEIQFDHNNDGIDRRGFLKCMAWAGTGAFCVMQGGVLKSYSLSRIADLDPSTKKGEPAGADDISVTRRHLLNT